MSNHSMSAMPTKLKYKLTALYCLISLIPNLVVVYVISLILKDWNALSVQQLLMVTLLVISSVILSLAGLMILRQLANPIESMAKVATKIAHGELEATNKLTGSEEIEELSQSLKAISANAKELIEKVERLSTKDKLTDLYNANYLMERLAEEIQRAIHLQRPCSFAYAGIDHFEEYSQENGAVMAQQAIQMVALVFSRYLSLFDRAARVIHGEFAVIFPDRTKRKAIEIMDEIRKEVQIQAEKKGIAPVTLSAGLSENPIDGVTAEELYKKSHHRFLITKKLASNSIEAFA